MVIHIVQQEETLATISEAYNIPVDRIVLDNGLVNENLITGQAIAIIPPETVYTVVEGDTIESVCRYYNIDPMQLIRNNRFLIHKPNLVEGQTLVIQYPNTQGSVDTFGYAFPFIEEAFLQEALPYLTYLCIYGIKITQDAELTSTSDRQLIERTRHFGTSPLMMLQLLVDDDSSQMDAIYFMMTNPELSQRLILNIINVIKQNGYDGICVVISYFTQYNLMIYEGFLERLFQRLKENGLKMFVTISTQKISFRAENRKMIKSDIESNLDGLTIMYYNVNTDLNSPPGPVTSVTMLRNFIFSSTTILNESIINIGCPIIGIDWELPYVHDVSQVSILKYDDALDLARQTDSVIEIDPESQARFFKYRMQGITHSNEHIVWFVDAWTINELLNLIPQFGLNGTGNWNIMFFFAPMWSTINARFQINKIVSEMEKK